MPQSPTVVTSTEANSCAGLLSCSLRHLGCWEQFTAGQEEKHNTSEEHIDAVSGALRCLQLHHQTTEDNRKSNRESVNQSSMDDNSWISFPPLMESITNLVQEPIKSLYPETSEMNEMHSVIGEIDRARVNSAQAVSRLLQQNRSELHDLFNSATSSVQERQTLETSFVNPLGCLFNGFSANSDLERSIKTISSCEGFFMGRISDARSLITDAAARKKVYIDSSNFQAPHGDQKMWVRLYLNGKADHTTLAIEVCLDAPMRESFRGGAKFTIVDQSNAKPLVHLTQICIGSLEEVGNHFGSNAFADKNLLHVDPSRYIRDDKIILIVQLRADGDTHFANIFTNIRDALDEP